MAQMPSQTTERWIAAVALLGCLAAVGLTPRIAVAESAAPPCNEDADCRERFHEAQRLFKAGAYEQALPILQSVYYQHAELRALFPIAATLMRLKRPAEAIPFCERLLAAGVETDPARLAVVEKLLQQARDAVQAAPPPTDTTLAAPTPAPEPPPQQAMLYIPSKPEAPKPLYKRWWLWTAVGLGAGAAGALIGGLYSVLGPPVWPGAPTVHPAFQ